MGRPKLRDSDRLVEMPHVRIPRDQMNALDEMVQNRRLHGDNWTLSMQVRRIFSAYIEAWRKKRA